MSTPRVLEGIAHLKDKPFYSELVKSILAPPRRDDRGCRHVRSKPLVEVFGVFVDSDLLHDGRPCQVFGDINITDGDGGETLINLYHRSYNDAESVVPVTKSLLQIGPHSHPISPCAGLRLDIHLYEKVRGIELAKGGFPLDFQGHIDSEHVTQRLVAGAQGSAAVSLATIRFATAAYLKIKLIDKVVGDVNCSPAQVCGEVVARYKKNYSSHSKDLSTVVFKRPADQPVSVKGNTAIELSKSVVSVPAYASLELDVAFVASGSQLNGALEFAADEDITYKKEIHSERYVIEVAVVWVHEDTLIPLVRKLKLSHKPDGEPAAVEQRKKPRLCSFQPTSELVVQPMNLTSGTFTEVFSVYIGYDGEYYEYMNLYGSIRVGHCLGPSRIFEKEKDHSEYLPPGSRTLPLNVHQVCFSGDCVSVSIDLKDVKDRLGIKGYLSYNYATVERWYDRCISSVIRGSHGYATIHYAIFKNGAQATVTVAVTSKGSTNIPINVHGSLFSEYGHWSYPTNYERDYYRSKLFERYPEKPLELDQTSQLTLMKSVIAVPLCSSLVINGHLDVNSGASEHLECNKEFKSSEGGMLSDEIEGEFFRVSIKVEWSISPFG